MTINQIIADPVAMDLLGVGERPSLEAVKDALAERGFFFNKEGLLCQLIISDPHGYPDSPCPP